MKMCTETVRVDAQSPSVSWKLRRIPRGIGSPNQTRRAVSLVPLAACEPRSVMQLLLSRSDLLKIAVSLHQSVPEPQHERVQDQTLRQWARLSEQRIGPGWV